MTAMREKLNGFIDFKITIGTIIHILVLLVGIGMAWAQLQEQNRTMKFQLEAVKADLLTQYVRADVQTERDKAIIQRLDDLKDQIKTLTVVAAAKR